MITYSRIPKILIGIGTAIFALFPILMMAFAIAFMFIPLFFLNLTESSEPNLAIFGVFFLIFPIMMLFGFLQLGMMIFYIINIVKNKTGSDVILILIAICLYFLPFFGMPAYFLIYILPKEPPDWAMVPKTT